MTTLRHGRPGASRLLDPLGAALLGLVAGMSLGSHLGLILSLLASIAGG